MIGRVLLALVLLTATARAQLIARVELSTEGWCSPAVVDTGGNVTINCQGVDPRALERLMELLNKKDLELAEKIREAEDWARQYSELRVQLGELGDTSSPERRQAEAALEEGELETAGTLLFDAYYNLGNMHRKEKNYDRAITNYEQAINSISIVQAPGNFGAHYNLADSYRRTGNVDKAIEHYQKANEITPNNSKVNYNLANMHRQDGEYDLAKKYYMRVIELEPEGSDLRHRAQKNLLSLGG